MGADITNLFDPFDQLLAQLCAAFNVPCTNDRRDAYRKAFGKLHIAAFERLVEHSLGEDGPEKFPTVKQLWGMRNEMRRHSETPSHVEPESFWDPWLVSANHRLLRHVCTMLGNDPRALGPVAPYLPAMRDLGIPNLGSPEQRRRTAVLVKWKNEWAKMMGEEAIDGEVDGKYQREIWDSYMRMAEQEFAA